MVYLAHIAESGEEQSVKDHCRNAAKYAAKALKSIGLEQTAYLAALLHDAGKMKAEFQDYLKKTFENGEQAKRGSVNHTFAGVRFALERWHDSIEVGHLETAELLAFAVGAHHGLFDCIDEHRSSGFQHRLTKEGIHYEESIHNFLKECVSVGELDILFGKAVAEIVTVMEKIVSLSKQECDETADQETDFYVGLLARALLSAVIEGDRRDTAEFMNDATFPEWPEDMRPIWTRGLEHMVAKLGSLKRGRDIDCARQSISDICAAAAQKPGGVYRLDVPTGGGKTLSSLRYALTHAKKWNKSRVIFTAPLLSILDQNAEVIREFVGDDSLILEHHSNMTEPQETPERLNEMELLTENWGSPIIITTLVQLLNTCFSGKTTAVRRFHALCNSVIVIDEVQTVPNKMLTLFNLMVNFLSEICSATIVLCSATQPCLESTCHPLLQSPPDLVPFGKELWNIFRRTEIQNAGQARLEEIPNAIKKILTDCESLLVVCNTKSEASYLFERLNGSDYRCFHLSAAMCVEHRRYVLHELQDALNAAQGGGRKVLCISTQLIEAGVDISFQQVVRFAAGMDSVIQSAGRCNRHAEQAICAPVRIIQCLDEKLRCLADIERAKKATISLLNQFDHQPEAFQRDLSSREAINYYYHSLYMGMNKDFQDNPVSEHGSLYQLLSDNSQYADVNAEGAGCFFMRQAFRLAGRLFQVFDEDTKSILVPYQKGREIRESLLAAAQGYGEKDWEAIRSCIRDAGGYSVSVYQYQWDELQRLGAVFSLFGDSIHILYDGFYDDNTGLFTKNAVTSFLGV